MAKKMAGSKEDLEAAIARKQVMTADTKAGILFFFPKIQIEWKKTWAAKETYSQKQEGNQLDYQAYSSAITSFLPGVSDLALSGAAAGSVASPSQNMFSIWAASRDPERTSYRSCRASGAVG